MCSVSLDYATISCDIANGGAGAGTALAVKDPSYAACDEEYCFWGNDGNGNAFCFEYAPTNALNRVEIHGTSYADTIDMKWGPGTYNLDYYAVAMQGVVFGGGGADLISGSYADNSYYKETLHGDSGNDVVHGWDGDDELTGDSGDDDLDGGAGDDVARGGDGDDLINGNDGNDRLYGGDGIDYIAGLPGDDSIWGDGHEDVLCGDTGTDDLHGGLGADYLWDADWNAALNLYDGGSQTDECSYYPSSPPTINCESAPPAARPASCPL